MKTPVALCCLLLLIATTATAEPIHSGATQVLDGDTISARGKTGRLVGLETPEGDGPSFVNEAQSVPPPATSNNLNIQANGCAVAGCNGELCVSASEANIGTVCESRAEYACYREASCEPQADGKCEWTQTAKLRQCLANPPAMEGIPRRQNRRPIRPNPRS